MSDQDRWTVDLTDVAGDVRRVSRQPAQRVGRRDHVMASLQQALDYSTPAGSVGERAVNQDDRRLVTHFEPSSFLSPSGAVVADDGVQMHLSGVDQAAG